MIPPKGTKLGLWERFWELQYKILFSSPSTQNVHSHMYSSEPLDWPLMVRGVAYWLSEHDNVCKFNLITQFILLFYLLLIGFDLYNRDKFTYWET